MSLLRLLVLAGALWAAAAQENVTVEENDSRLMYDPWVLNWDRFSNPITLNGTVYNNYFHGGSYVAIHAVGGSVSMVFNGSYIAYYGDEMDNHGRMRITLDGVVTERTSYSPTAVPQSLLFESDTDPNVPNHKITLTCLEDGKNMGFDYFLFTTATPTPVSQPGSPNSITGSSSSTDAQSSSPATGSPQVTATKSDDTPTIIAAVFAGLGWAVALVFGFLLFCFKRRKTAETGPVDMEEHRDVADQRTVSAFTADQPTSESSGHRPSIVAVGPPAMRTKPRVFSTAKPARVVHMQSEDSVPGSSSAYTQTTEAAGAAPLSPPAYDDRD